MAWLLRDGDVLAAVEVAESFGSRLRGLLGRDSLEGALLLRPARSVHTIGMKFAIDVAYLDGDGVVLAVRTMRPWRIGFPRWRARTVIEAAGRAFERWGVHIGDRLEVR